MAYRNLENAQPDAGDFHLHLQIPAVSFLTHVEFRKCVAANGAKRAHVGVTNAVKQSQNQSGNASRQNLLEVHTAWFALPARARADHEIVRAARDWVHKLIHKRRDIAAVAVEKYNDLAFRRKSADARCTCAPVTARRSHDARTRFTRTFGRVIGAAVIDHDHLVR